MNVEFTIARKIARENNPCNRKNLNKLTKRNRITRLWCMVLIAAVLTVVSCQTNAPPSEPAVPPTSALPTQPAVTPTAAAPAAPTATPIPETMSIADAQSIDAFDGSDPSLPEIAGRDPVARALMDTLQEAGVLDGLAEEPLVSVVYGRDVGGVFYWMPLVEVEGEVYAAVLDPDETINAIARINVPALIAQGRIAGRDDLYFVPDHAPNAPRLSLTKCRKTTCLYPEKHQEFASYRSRSSRKATSISSNVLSCSTNDCVIWSAKESICERMGAKTKTPPISNRVN